MMHILRVCTIAYSWPVCSVLCPQVAEVQKENARLEALNAKLVHVHAAPEQVEQAVETRQLLKDHDELRANYTAMLQERESHTAEYKALHDQFATLQAEVRTDATFPPPLPSPALQCVGSLCKQPRLVDE
jgi:uncharacterized protein YPO0396